MTSDFEQLLRTAAPGVPDPGDVRRMNRRDIQRALVPLSRRRRLGAQVMVACTALVLVGMVFVGDLGSDNFDITSVNATGENAARLGIPQIYRVGLRGQVVPRMEGWTENDAREFANQDYNDEGELLRIEGWESDKGSIWSMVFSAAVDGEEIMRSRQPKGMAPQISREFRDFLVNDLPAVKSDLQRVPGPSSREQVVAIEGVPRVFRTWTFAYPGQGTVTYYQWDVNR